ncbi:DUF998 domain-containing protein [Hydrogenophaga taeniospiralis]|nr:DUF998 domain-containing protein [Hydrogenophaga taeniospiralis]
MLSGAQPGYDPIQQFMSELALGPWGGFMIVAFVGLAVLVAASAAHLRASGTPKLLTHTLALAAICLVGAGAITLGDSVSVHVALVALAFALCGLAMYLLPRLARTHGRPMDHLISWGAGLVMCAATALGGLLIPVGIAQRLSAGALMFWLLWVVWRRHG